jgi:serine protease Do
MIVGGDLAFAIPGTEAGNIVRQLIARGRVDRVSLGFRLRSLKGTAFTQGVLVNSVERGSPPEQAGLQAGDRILNVNGKEVDALQPVDVPYVQQMLAELPVDSTVKLRVERGGKQSDIELKAQPQPPGRGREQALAPFGISGSNLTADMGKRRNLDARAGVLVTGVRPGGPAAVARPEIEAGSVITAIDGKPVGNIEELGRLADSVRGRKEPSMVVRVEVNGEQRLSLVKPVFGDQSRDPLPELPQAWVGVEVQPFTGSLAKDIGLPNAGFRISRIYPGSPLGKAGAKVGDLLVAMEGRPHKPSNDISAEDFDQQVHDLTVGTQAKFSAVREGKPVEFAIDVQPSPVDTSGLRTLALDRLRAQLRELGFYDRVALKLPTDRAGVFIDGVESGGAAGLAHLKRGDVIVSLGERAVADPGELSAALENALAAPGTGLIPLQVIRGNQTRILYLERYWLTVDGPEASK